MQINYSRLIAALWLFFVRVAHSNFASSASGLVTCYLLALHGSLVTQQHVPLSRQWNLCEPVQSGFTANDTCCCISNEPAQTGLFVAL